MTTQQPIPLEMIARAMNKAVQLGIFPEHAQDTTEYLKNWRAMEEILKAALSASQDAGHALIDGFLEDVEGEP